MMEAEFDCSVEMFGQSGGRDALVASGLAEGDGDAVAVWLAALGRRDGVAGLHVW